MTSADVSRPSLGEDLIAAGWRQGSIFSIPNACVYWNDIAKHEGYGTLCRNERKAKTKEQLILISQACDIKASPKDEPTVEALICEVFKNRNFITKIDRNSARWFVVDPINGLVANAKYRIQISKTLLATVGPNPWPSDKQRRRRFRQWLARRYNRPETPDSLVEAFEWPLKQALTELEQRSPAILAAFNKVIYEIRVNEIDKECPPFDLHLTMLALPTGMSKEEVAAVDNVFATIKRHVDPTLVHMDPYPRIVTEETMSLLEYNDTYPLFLDYYTYEGEEIMGAQPNRKN